jgi:hypothetical protein
VENFLSEDLPLRSFLESLPKTQKKYILTNAGEKPAKHCLELMGIADQFEYVMRIRGLILYVEDYYSVLLLPYSISSGAIGSYDLLLSYSMIAVALHINIILTMACHSVFLHLQFRYVYGSDFMGTVCKPEKEAFQKVLDHINPGQDPCRVVMFEDSYKNLVTANSMGMSTVFVESEIHVKEEGVTLEQKAMLSCTVNTLSDEGGAAISEKFPRLFL